MHILGLSFHYHDSAACLLKDGVPIAMAEEERFSRKKNDSAFPVRAIEFVLREAKLRPADLDWVVFYEKPFLKFERLIKTALATFPSAPAVFAQSMKHFFLDKLWVRSLIASEVGVPPEKVLFSGHHHSHAASAFFTSPWERAAILTVDGVGEWTTTAIYLGEGNHIRLIREIRFPHSLGLLYSAFTAYLGFEVNEGEYKVMGMAPYGTPRYTDKVKKLIILGSDGSFRLDLKYFSFHKSLTKSFSREFVDLFGPSRDPKSHFFTRNTGWPSYFGPKPEGATYDRLAEKQEYYADVAASVQAVLEEALCNLAKEAHRLTNTDYLCLGGGVALNSVANWKIAQKAPFKDVHIQPAAGDAGGALGAALAIHRTLKPDSPRFVMQHGLYGETHATEAAVVAAKKSPFRYEVVGTHLKDVTDSVLSFPRRRESRLYKEILDLRAKPEDDKIILEMSSTDEDTLINRVCDALIDGKVVGWLHGRFEWGPRALGSRSILADPRRADMKGIVNTKIKFREPYRPFAPSVLAEHAEEYFEMPSATTRQPARFMLYVVPVRKEKREVVPAITHVDGTARPQLVFKEQQPRYWKLINCFYERTGVPMLLNTSFNLKGEPIVNTPDDALHTFERSHMDMLVMENVIVYRDFK